MIKSTIFTFIALILAAASVASYLDEAHYIAGLLALFVTIFAETAYKGFKEVL